MALMSAKDSLPSDTTDSENTQAAAFTLSLLTLPNVPLEHNPLEKQTCRYTGVHANAAQGLCPSQHTMT